jgi:hypothetical protein
MSHQLLAGGVECEGAKDEVFRFGNQPLPRFLIFPFTVTLTVSGRCL